MKPDEIFEDSYYRDCRACNGSGREVFVVKRYGGDKGLLTSIRVCRVCAGFGRILQLGEDEGTRNES